MWKDQRLARDFRRRGLPTLLEDPTSWRIRRVDECSLVDLRSFHLKSEFDLRFPRSFVAENMDRLLSHYSWAEDLAALEQFRSLFPTSDSHAPLSDDSIANAVAAFLLSDDEDWDSLDLLIPLYWAPGPLMNLHIEVDGSPVVPLTRFQAADVMSGGLMPLLFRNGLLTGLIPPEHYKDQSAFNLSMHNWNDFGWCVTATDPHFLIQNQSLRRMTLPLDSTANRLRLRRWTIDRLRRYRYSHATLDGLPDLKPGSTLDQLVLRSEDCRKRLSRCEKLANYRSGIDDALNPLVNPILLFDAYLKKAFRNYRESEGSVQAEDILRSFFSMAELWMDFFAATIPYLCTSNTKGRTDTNKTTRHPSDVLFQLAKLSRSVPVLVRHTVPVEESVRFVVHQDVPIPRRWRQSETRSSAEHWRLLWCFNTITWWPRFLVETSRGVFDLLLRQVGFRPRLRSELRAIGFPLALHDSASYHLEFHVDSMELDVIDRASFIKWPMRDYGCRWLRDLLDGTALQGIFPRLRLDARSVFDRVTDTTSERHHYYVTNVRAQCIPEVGSLRPRLAAVPGDLLLFVRCRVTSYVSWVNWLLAATSFGIACVLARTAVLMWVDRYNGTLGFLDQIKMAAPLLLGVAVLFAVQQRRNRFADYRILRPAFVIILSYVIAIVASLGWIMKGEEGVIWASLGFLNGWWHDAAGAVLWVGDAAKDGWREYGKIVSLVVLVYSGLGLVRVPLIALSAVVRLLGHDGQGEGK